MKAQELRIGNKVLCLKYNRIVEIDGIEPNHDFVWLNYCNGSAQYKTSLESIKPIELTEEILLKCKGVKKQEHKIFTNKYSLKLKIGKYLIITDIGTPNFMIGIADMSLDNSKIEDLVNVHNYDFDKQISLHKFQNLYYAITNQELEVKL